MDALGFGFTRLRLPDTGLRPGPGLAAARLCRNRAACWSALPKPPRPGWGAAYVGRCEVKHGVSNIGIFKIVN